MRFKFTTLLLLVIINVLDGFRIYGGVRNKTTLKTCLRAAKKKKSEDIARRPSQHHFSPIHTISRPGLQRQRAALHKATACILAGERDNDDQLILDAGYLIQSWDRIGSSENNCLDNNSLKKPTYDETYYYATQIEALIKVLTNKGVCINISMFNHLLSAWVNVAASTVTSHSITDDKLTDLRSKSHQVSCRVQRKYEAAKRAHSLLRYVIREASVNRTKKNVLRPDKISYDLVLKGFCDCEHPSAVGDAWSLYSGIINGPIECKTNNNNKVITIHPVASSLRRLIHFLCFSNNATDFQSCLSYAIKAEEVLEFMEEVAFGADLSAEIDACRQQFKPRPLDYENVIQGFVKCLSHRRQSSGDNSWISSSRGSEVAKRAERLLHRMIYLRKHNNEESLQPSIKSYNCVINAWSKSGNRSGAKRAEKILSYLEDHSSSIIDTYSYTTVIDAFCKSGDPAKAEEVLKRMENNGRKTLSNYIHYNSILSAWSKSRIGSIRNASEGCERVLAQMNYLAKEGINPFAKPDVISYNTVLSVLCRSGRARRCVELLDEMEILAIEPNLYTYNVILDAFVKSRKPNAVYSAESVLEKMINFAKAKGLQPTRHPFELVLGMYFKGANYSTGKKAELLVERMSVLSRSTFPKIRPTASTYALLMNVFSSIGDENSAKRIGKWIRNMQNAYNEQGLVYLKPTIECYNSYLYAWANTGTLKGAENADRCLRRLVEDYVNNDTKNCCVKPDINSFNAVILAWARSKECNAALKAESILQLMSYTKTHPDCFTYNTLINAWSKSSRPRKAQKALSLLRGMNAFYEQGNEALRPNEFTYASVLNACAFSSKEQKALALHIALTASEELHRSESTIQHNHVTYGSFLKALALLMDDEDKKRSVVEASFLQCCADGQVGRFVLSQLKDAAPDDLYQRLLRDVIINVGGTREIQMSDLPPEWSRNVRERFKNEPR